MTQQQRHDERPPSERRRRNDRRPSEEGRHTAEQDVPEHVVPLRFEATVFAAGIAFFVPVGLIYGWLSGWEPVGSVGFLMLGAMCALVSAYLWITGRRLDPLPEDNPTAEIEERAGEVGTFSPHAWAPLVIGGGAALAFLGTAVGWWLTGIGVVVALGGLVFQVTEFSRGQHVH